MDPSTRAKTASLFRGIAWFFFAGAGFAFWFAGRVIQIVVPGTDHMLAEIEGFAVVLLFGTLGALAKGAEGHLEAGEVDPRGPKSFRDALRK